MKRVAIVGCGGIARVHVWVLGQLEDCAVTAFCDTDPAAAERLAQESVKEGWLRNAGEPAFCLYESLDRVIQEHAADVIHLCTPHHLHVPMAALALRNQLSVFLEKPVAITGEQFEQLQRAAGESDGALGVCFQNRYNPATKVLDELVASGKVGEVLGARAFVTWRRDEEYYEKSPWKGRLETEGGGALMNQAVHTLDLLLRYLGEPLNIEAGIANHHLRDRIEVEDTVEAWMEFAGGKRACFYASNAYATDAPIWLELQCEKGRLTLIGDAVLVARDGNVQLVPCEQEPGIGKSYWGAGHLACIRDFYDCMKEKRRFQNDLQGVRATALTALKIYEKGRENVWNR